MYSELKTPWREKIYKIAKAHAIAIKDLTHTKKMKGENGEVLTDERKIRGR